MKPTVILRNTLMLSLLSVSRLTFALCTELPTFDPNTGKLDIPCFTILGGAVTTINSASLQKRPSDVRVNNGFPIYDLENNTGVKTVINYKVGDIYPYQDPNNSNNPSPEGIVFALNTRGGGLLAKANDYIVSGRISFTWPEAMQGAQSYGAGWRLPTKDELNLLYQQRGVVGGFGLGGFHWSSTEVDANHVWFQNFTNGYQYTFLKIGLDSRVRAVRAF